MVCRKHFNCRILLIVLIEWFVAKIVKSCFLKAQFIDAKNDQKKYESDVTHQAHIIFET